MTEQEAVACIEEWDVTEAAKVLKWYENDELLRPCDCDTIVAIETEDLEAENDKLRERIDDAHMSRLLTENENESLRELAKELFKLADRGLMELNDDDFRRIVKEAEELGLTDSLDEVRAPGRGTCHVMYIGEFNGEATEYYDVCSNCGYEFDDDPLNYCPNCGARIEVDA